MGLYCSYRILKVELRSSLRQHSLAQPGAFMRWGPAGAPAGKELVCSQHGRAYACCSDALRSRLYSCQPSASQGSDRQVVLPLESSASRRFARTSKSERRSTSAADMPLLASGARVVASGSSNSGSRAPITQYTWKELGHPGRHSGLANTASCTQSEIGLVVPLADPPPQRSSALVQPVSSWDSTVRQCHRLVRGGWMRPRRPQGGWRKGSMLHDPLLKVWQSRHSAEQIVCDSPVVFAAFKSLS